MTRMEKQAAKEIVQHVRAVLSGEAVRITCGVISVEMFDGELSLSREAAKALLARVK